MRRSDAISPFPLRLLHMLWAGLGRAFTPLESQLLREFGQLLDSEGRAIYDAQLNAVNFVQRPPRSRETNMYRRRHGKIDWSDLPAFPRPEREFEMARLKFKDEPGTKFDARLYVVNGHAFSLEVRPSPRKIRWSPRVEVTTSRLVNDPMVSSVEPQDPFAKFEVVPPPDYADSLQGRGFTIDDRISLLGPEDVYQVFVADSHYVIIGELIGEASFLVLKAGLPEPQVFLFEHDADSPLPAGSTMKEACAFALAMLDEAQ